ncbi:hypothetical protein CWS72_02140 [Telmatospirillum siberiense]|uniref:Flagellar protein FlgN n=1 Tax=Telmatospirillum siberiense TaxID=382514 RepID=A0A2N3PZY0_9PROT|nr:hypothetical protein CWS72_02140 [Telmatospirillum siberiense]
MGNKPTRPPMAASHPGKPPAVAGRPGQPAATGPAGPAATKAAAGTAKAMPKIDPRTLPGSLGPMVEAIQVYDDLLIEENEALKAGDSKAVEALLDRKMAATRLYQERLRALLAEPQNKRGITPEQRSLVTAMVRRLEERAKENTTLLKANMKAIEQLFEVINTAARRMRRQDVSYSKAGMMCDGYIRNGVSLAYNNTI